MNSSLLSIAEWIEWKDSTGFDGDKSQCWECYLRNSDKWV